MGNIISFGYWATTARDSEDSGTEQTSYELNDVQDAVAELLASTDVDQLTPNDISNAVGVNEADLRAGSLLNLINKSESTIDSLKKMIHLVDNFKGYLMAQRKNEQPQLGGYGGDEFGQSPGGLSFPEKRMLIESSLAMKTPSDIVHRRQEDRVRKRLYRDNSEEDGRGSFHFSGLPSKARSRGEMNICGKSRNKF